MADFVNTIDLLGDEAVTKALVERTIEEFNDDVLKDVGKYAFAKCSALVSVNLPLVKSIDEHSFDSTSLPNVDLPEATNVGDYAFRKCGALTSINIPNVTRLGTGAFYECTSLTGVNLPLWKPNSPTSYVFENCSSLPSIDLPKVARIGTSMFSGCTVLKTVILRVTSVCSLSRANAFDKTPFASGGTGGTLLVPRALVTEYPNETNWSAVFSGNANNRVLALEDYTVDGTITGEIDWDKLNGGN